MKQHEYLLNGMNIKFIDLYLSNCIKHTVLPAFLVHVRPYKLRHGIFHPSSQYQTNINLAVYLTVDWFGIRYLRLISDSAARLVFEAINIA